jgi:DNA (cytosine-5)-methyltransferase 1
MRHGSLFSGIGGFDLAAEWMGWENVFHCEWNTFGQKVLHHYWPKAEQFTDITKSDFTKYANKIDILTGGFPCQPYSSAGKRLGKEDERHLWPEMLRAIKEISPRWVVGENVLGLVNWSGGLVFHEVQADLEAEGYEVQPYVLNAASIGAAHKRDRVWFVAQSNHPRTDIGMRDQREWSQNDNEREGQPFSEYRQNGSYGDAPNSNLHGCNERNGNDEVNPSKGRLNAFCDIDESNGNGDVADTMQIRLQQCENGGEMESGQGEMGREGGEFANATQTNGEVRYAADTCDKGLQGGQVNRNFAEKKREGEYDRNSSRQISIGWQNFPSVSPICNGDDGISDRLDSITFSKWRNESIKAGGNAIVPQVVYQIFKTIEHYENLQNL